MNECLICTGKADVKFKRVEIWSNKNLRLTMSTYITVKGLCYLEPKRHIEYITDLDGEEAIEFGGIIAQTTRAIKKATNAKLVYIYIYGDHIPHLHVHLAPHTADDIFYDNIVKVDGVVGIEFLDLNVIHILSDNINKNLK